jgi:endonuclease/exonuclease/phosphatase family metal-dependent hydrolase
MNRTKNTAPKNFFTVVCILIQFAEEHNLFILNTFYKKPPTAKWTWRSPDGKTKNEIDFILSNSRGNVEDVQVLNDLKFDSDHRMVRATLKLYKG